MPPTIAVTIASDELGLDRGDLAQLDAAVRQLPREALVARTVAVLNALATLGKKAKTMSEHLAQILPDVQKAKLLSALSKPNALFVEPWQQLLVLRRTLEARPEEVTSEFKFESESGESCYFDICRFASDALRPPNPFGDEPAKDDPDAWVKIAAQFMPWLWLLNPPDVAAWIARSEIMFRQLPEADEKIKDRVAALTERFPKVFSGLSFSEVLTLIQFLTLWWIELKPAQIFANHFVIRLNPDTWLKDTNLPKDALHRLLDRAGSRADKQLTGAGEPKSPLPFRSRPFLLFADGSCAPVYPPFMLEKLTPDIFWWLKPIDEDQRLKWQDDWGYVAEAYVIDVLTRVAAIGNCTLASRIDTDEGEVDAVILANGHVALIEITSSSLREEETMSADWEQLREGLQRVFVENPTGKKGPCKEAAMQLVRDVRVLLEGRLRPVPKPKTIKRIYPVMVCADRRLRTPGVVNFLQNEFRQRLPAHHKAITADLAVLGLEDIDELESILAPRKPLHWGEVRGLLAILRRWDKDRGPAPSWWQFVEAMWGHQGRNKALQQAFKKRSDEMVGRFESK